MQYSILPRLFSILLLRFIQLCKFSMYIFPSLIIRCKAGRKAVFKTKDDKKVFCVNAIFTVIVWRRNLKKKFTTWACLFPRLVDIFLTFNVSKITLDNGNWQNSLLTQEFFYVFLCRKLKWVQINCVQKKGKLAMIIKKKSSLLLVSSAKVHDESRSKITSFVWHFVCQK